MTTISQAKPGSREWALALAAMPKAEAIAIARDFCRRLRAGEFAKYSDAASRGRRLTTVRAALKFAGVDSEIIAVCYDRELTTAKNTEYSEVTIPEKLDHPKEVPVAFARSTIQKAINTLYRELMGVEQKAHRTNEQCQRIIRYLVAAGAMRRNEFFTIRVFRKDGDFVCTGYLKGRGDSDGIASPSQEPREFVGLVPGDQFYACLREARQWVALRGDDLGYRVLCPAEDSNRLSADYPGLTYHDLRRFGATFGSRVHGKTDAQRTLIASAMLRHKVRPETLAVYQNVKLSPTSIMGKILKKRVSISAGASTSASAKSRRGRPKGSSRVFAIAPRVESKRAAPTAPAAPAAPVPEPIPEPPAAPVAAPAPAEVPKRGRGRPKKAEIILPIAVDVAPVAPAAPAAPVAPAPEALKRGRGRPRKDAK